MELFPSTHIIYRTRLTGEEVLARLKNYIEPEKMFRVRLFAGSGKPYEGRIDGWQFRIRRIIVYRNSALPVITGTIGPDGAGTTIRVSMKIHTAVLIFFVFFCLCIGLAGFIFLMLAIKSKTFHPAFLIPFGMMLLGYFISTSGFRHESRKSVIDLKNLFEADIIPS